jgi:putative CocE/NonD family hydrolase
VLPQIKNARGGEEHLMTQESRLTLDTQLPFGAINPPPPQYRGMVRSSFYLTMRDGVKLAVTLQLPKGLPADARIPALLSQGRYWREMELNPPLGWFLTADQIYKPLGAIKPFFVSRGYALVSVDVRGTGASFGRWASPWPADELEDSREIVDWIVAQPWSNERVGGYGISYLGTSAERLAVLGHPAVKAVIPMFNHPDSFIDIAFPGGVFNKRFIQAWDGLNRGLDANKVPPILGAAARMALKGVMPVDGDKDRQLLRQAILEHAGNTNIFNTAEPIACRDEKVGSLGISIDDIAMHHYQEALASSQVAIFGWGSWMDAGTGDAALRRFLTLEHCQRTVVGAWEHGGQFHASPYSLPDRPAKPSLEAQWAEMVRFFDARRGSYSITASERRSGRAFPPGRRPGCVCNAGTFRQSMLCCPCPPPRIREWTLMPLITKPALA